MYLPLLLFVCREDFLGEKTFSGLPAAHRLSDGYRQHLSRLYELPDNGRLPDFPGAAGDGASGEGTTDPFPETCLGMLLGVLMGLCVLLPTAYVIFRVSSRLESELSLGQRLLQGFVPMDGETYLTMLYRFFSANLLNKNGDYAGNSNYYEDPSLFASIFW